MDVPDGVVFVAGPSSPRAGRRFGPVIIGILALLVAAAGAAGLFVFTALRGSGDVIDRMIPASSSVYITAYLDPAAQQKLNLRNLVKRFPRLRSDGGLDKGIDELLDEALHGSGLTSKDVRPWLGSQVALVVRVKNDRPLVALLVASKDDSKALAALGKFRSGPDGRRETWKQMARGGIAISVGSRAGRTDGAYALVNHAAVIANDPGIIEDVIDTAQRRQPSLRGSTRFVKTTGQLPSKRLALMYVDFRPLIGRIKQDVTVGQIPDLGQLSSSLGQLDALQGLGATISAEATGIAADITMTIDRSKLTEEQRRAYAETSHENAVLPFTPRHAYGVLAMEGFPQTVRSAIEELSKDPSFEDMDRDLGLSSIVKHLTGDAGFEAGPGSPGEPPGVALLFGTDDEVAMRAFLDRLAVKALEGVQGHPKRRPPHWKRVTHRGVTISFLPLEGADPFDLTPAYAVTRRMGILASSLDELKAVIDARADGSSITSARNFIDAVGTTRRNVAGMLYIDVGAITSAFRDAMPSEQQARFDAETAKDLAPLKAFVLTSSNGPDRASVRLFLLIG
jgi:hypothetical protein